MIVKLHSVFASIAYMNKDVRISDCNICGDDHITYSMFDPACIKNE